MRFVRRFRAWRAARRYRKHEAAITQMHTTGRITSTDLQRLGDRRFRAAALILTEYREATDDRP